VYLKDIELYNNGNSGTWSRADAILTGNDAALLNDQEADVTETGSGITPIFGMNIAASDKINIGFKLEFPTFIELQRETRKDIQIGFLKPGNTIPDTMYPDGRKFNSDMPAMLSTGISYQILRKLLLSVSGNIYFDRGEKLYYGKQLNREYVRNLTLIDKNSYEVGGGFEYRINSKVLVSGGYLLSNNFVNSYYQSDASYSLNSKTYCLGAAYNVKDNIQINFGLGYTAYPERYKAIKYEVSQTNIQYPIETYNSSKTFAGVGIDFSF
jgi:long-subunit fatty acid transport protein